MKCPYCQSRDSKVVDSRDAEASIRRRRECLSCTRRFTTYERVEMASLMITKRDNRREEFSRDKLTYGIGRAFDKRPVAFSTIEAMIESLVAELHGRPGNEVTSAEIAQIVMLRLRDIDQIAYIRYASAYREFADLDRLRDQLDSLIATREQARAQKDQLQLFSGDEMKRLLDFTN